MNNSRISNRFYKAVSSIAAEKPDLILQQARKLSNTAFSVTASHGHYKEDLLKSDYMDMFLAATGGQFNVVPDTLILIGKSQGGDTVVAGIIEANCVTKPFVETEVRDHMKVITANVFADDEDNIWRVVESNGVRQLVQSAREDYAELVKSRLANRSATIVSSATYTGAVSPKNGDYVMFYDTDNCAINYGYAISVAGDLHVGSRHTGQLTKVDNTQVIEAIDGGTIDRKYALLPEIAKASATPTESDFTKPLGDEYLDYMSKLFAHTAYFQGLEKLIGNRRRVGATNTPLSLINY